MRGQSITITPQGAVSPSPFTTPDLGDEVQVVFPDLEVNRERLEGV